MDLPFYQQLKEISWMTSVEQVLGTMPNAFKEKYPSMFAVIDASELILRRHQVSNFNRPLGAITNITTQLSF